MGQPHNPEPSVDSTTISEFLNSLQRLFKIAIYYPTGHAILDKALERFIFLLKRLAGNNLAVTVSDHEDSLMIEGIVVAHDLPFVQEFKSILSVLAITSIKFDRGINLADLHVFIKKILQYRSRAMKARQFTQIEIAELPPSISLNFKQFTARKNTLASDEKSGEFVENIETFTESLKSYGLSGEEINRCRSLLESLPKQLADSSVELKELPYASWDDVARLLANVVRAGQQQGGDLKTQRVAQSNINALAVILKKLEQETGDKKSQDTINLLISIIRKPISGSGQEETPVPEEVGPRTFPSTPYHSIAQIQEFTNKNRLHPKILANIPESLPHNETLSITLQLARYDQSLPNQLHMQKLFRDSLSGPIQDSTWPVLSGGLHTLLADDAPSRVSTIMRFASEPLRSSLHGSSLKMMLSTAKLCKESERMAIWPYVVNELLVCGSAADEASFKSLCQFAAQFNQEDMSANLNQLKALDAFQNSTIASAIFPILPADSFPLFAFLLKIELNDSIGERILGGLRKYPPDWLSKGVAHLLDLSQPEHKLFLYSYLREAAQEIVPTALRSAAARIIAKALPALTPEKRTESGVIDSISVLTRLFTEETKALLEQIATERKLLFIPEWPSECRKAAELALAEGKKMKREEW